LREIGKLLGPKALLASEHLHVKPEYCVVFKDAEAGIEAAGRAGMGAVGIGKPGQLKDADAVVAGLHQLLTLLPGCNA
jgi:beta-phosphoglucomutase